MVSVHYQVQLTHGYSQYFLCHNCHIVQLNSWVEVSSKIIKILWRSSYIFRKPGSAERFQSVSLQLDPADPLSQDLIRHRVAGTIVTTSGQLADKTVLFSLRDIPGILEQFSVLISAANLEEIRSLVKWICDTSLASAWTLGARTTRQCEGDAAVSSRSSSSVQLSKHPHFRTFLYFVSVIN